MIRYREPAGIIFIACFLGIAFLVKLLSDIFHVSDGTCTGVAVFGFSLSVLAADLIYRRRQGYSLFDLGVSTIGPLPTWLHGVIYLVGAIVIVSR